MEYLFQQFLRKEDVGKRTFETYKSANIFILSLPLIMWLSTGYMKTLRTVPGTL